MFRKQMASVQLRDNCIYVDLQIGYNATVTGWNIQTNDACKVPIIFHFELLVYEPQYSRSPSVYPVNEHFDGLTEKS